MRSFRSGRTSCATIFGVSHVIYHTANIKGEQVGAFTYDIAWVRHYIEKDYKSIDPVVLGALRRFHPMDWKTLDWSSPQARQMMREAHGSGARQPGLVGADLGAER